MEYLVFFLILALVLASGYFLSKPLISPPDDRAIRYFANEPKPDSSQTGLGKKE